MIYSQQKATAEERAEAKAKRKELRKDNLGIEPKENKKYSLKRSYIKKSSNPKKNKRSKLDIEKSKPNSKYWLKKCDDLFMAQGRGEPCAYCGTTINTCFHHIVPKGRCKALRYDLMNMMVLCPSHHNFSNVVAPHSTNSFAVERFVIWLRENHTRKYEYCLEREHWNRRYTFKDVYFIFLEQKKNNIAIQF